MSRTANTKVRNNGAFIGEDLLIANSIVEMQRSWLGQRQPASSPKKDLLFFDCGLAPTTSVRNMKSPSFGSNTPSSIGPLATGFSDHAIVILTGPFGR